MIMNASPDPSVRRQQLRSQHRDWEHAGYDGHNRHSGLTRMSTLRGRRVRRRVRRSLAWLARGWNPPVRASRSRALLGQSA
jgi:hypothetical protein